jgi:MoxR-like ATPase
MEEKQMTHSRLESLQCLREEIGKVLVGQDILVEKLIIALLCKGHVLIEGVPGLAKTLAVSTLAQAIHGVFRRIQFTPDLLPGDLVGTLVYNPKTGDFTPHKGPIFANLVLADEVNRSPAKVQSALLEAMQEKQVTMGDVTYTLDEPFMVLATQNPIEQEGTYQLPEAQLDRFFFKVSIDYPSFDEEQEIMRRMARSAPVMKVEQVLDGPAVIDLQSAVDEVFLKENMEHYILRVVDATRHPDNYGLDFADCIRHGASPRASIFLALASRAQAMMEGRDYVIPADVEAISLDVLRHRVALSYKAQAQGMQAEDLIRRIFDVVDPA